MPLGGNHMWRWLTTFLQRLQTYMRIELWKRIKAAYIWPIALYGSEIWTQAKKDGKKLEAEALEV